MYMIVYLNLIFYYSSMKPNVAGCNFPDLKNSGSQGNLLCPQYRAKCKARICRCNPGGTKLLQPQSRSPQQIPFLTNFHKLFKTQKSRVHFDHPKKDF